MSRTPARFREADVKRALRAAEAVGVKVTVEIARDGTIRLVPVEDRLTYGQAQLAPAKRMVF